MRRMMKKYFKGSILTTIRSLGFDLVKIQEKPFSIFVDDRAIVSTVKHQGNDLRFLIANPNDMIQKVHLKGELYEPEELLIIEKHYTPDTTFIDIGSNVGNHAIWAATCLGAPSVIAFEPALNQHTLFCVNVALNNLSDIIKVRKLALSNSVGQTCIDGGLVNNNNTGGNRIMVNALGETIQLSTGDIELSDVGPSFIKIDVEGHEISALEGLKHFIDEHRPKMFIEVDVENKNAFEDWLNSNRYQKLDEFQRYERNCNYMIAPVE